MLSGLYALLSFVVAISILIVVHEFGHYWVARRAGVKVLRFSIGFGKPLYKRTFGKDQTEFVIAMLPLGGYVKMLDETEGAVDAAELDRAFNRKSLAKRSAVVLAGPVFNLVFAVLAYWVIFVHGTDGFRPIVGHVVENSPASVAGFKVGDELISVDGKDIKTWGHRRLYLFSRLLDKEPVTFIVQSTDGRKHELHVNLDNLSLSSVGSSIMGKGLGLYLQFPEVKAVVGGLIDGPAKKAGLMIGDRITQIDGQEVDSWVDMAKLIQSSAGKELHVTYLRGEVQKTTVIVPKPSVQNGKTIGLIGISPKAPAIPADMIRRLQFGPVQGLEEAVVQTWTMSEMTLKILGKMLTREVSTKNISGPITIADYAGQAASIGLSEFIVFLAAISISLGVLNLLPIPVLDGGHLMYYIIEAIKGSPVSELARIRGQQIGFVILIMFMILAFYNDIIRKISN
jgi:regulator of sigma E protease